MRPDIICQKLYGCFPTEGILSETANSVDDLRTPHAAERFRHVECHHVSIPSGQLDVRFIRAHLQHTERLKSSHHTHGFWDTLSERLVLLERLNCRSKILGLEHNVIADILARLFNTGAVTLARFLNSETLSGIKDKPAAPTWPPYVISRSERVSSIAFMSKSP